MQEKSQTALEHYFSNLFYFHGPTVSAAENLRAVVKWTFDFLRNLIIVGLLQFFAVSSGSKVLLGVAHAAYILLIMYCFSYFDTWTIRPFHPLKNQKLARILNIVCGVLLFVPLWLATFYLLSAAVEEVSKRGAN